MNRQRICTRILIRRGTHNRDGPSQSWRHSQEPHRGWERDAEAALRGTALAAGHSRGTGGRVEQQEAAVRHQGKRHEGDVHGVCPALRLTREARWSCRWSVAGTVRE